MILVDSNILIYAINRSSPKHTIAQQFLQQEKEKLVLAHQNIFEALRVLTHPRYPKPMKINPAIEAVISITSNLDVIYPFLETQQLSLELLKKYKLTSNQIFDGYLVATMLSNGIDKIATDNVKDFQKFKYIKVINPFNL